MNDVGFFQTAFASYGEIKHCFIVDEKNAKEGDQLIARITFSKHDEAKTACHKLECVSHFSATFLFSITGANVVGPFDSTVAQSQMVDH